MSFNTYPAALPNLPTLTALSQVGTNCSDVDLQGTTMRQWMAAVGTYVLAIATKVGVNGSTDVSSVTYALAHVITNEIPRTLIYNDPTDTWIDPTSRIKIYRAMPTDPNPPAAGNDVVIRSRAE